eukprot:4027525-Alexandrium_andersonii.AAC.1
MVGEGSARVAFGGVGTVGSSPSITTSHQFFKKLKDMLAIGQLQPGCVSVSVRDVGAGPGHTQLCEVALLAERAAFE